MLLLAVACEDQNSSPDRRASREGLIEGTGTITQAYPGFGGYLINGDDGEIYAPLDLPEEFQVEGRRVWFSAIEVTLGEVGIPEAPRLVSIVEIRTLPTEKG